MMNEGPPLPSFQSSLENHLFTMEPVMSVGALVFGVVAGIHTSGSIVAVSGELATVQWAIGSQSTVPAAELSLTSPRSAGVFPV